MDQPPSKLTKFRPRTHINDALWILVIKPARGFLCQGSVEKGGGEVTQPPSKSCNIRPRTHINDTLYVLSKKTFREGGLFLQKESRFPSQNAKTPAAVTSTKRCTSSA